QGRSREDQRVLRREPQGVRRLRRTRSGRAADGPARRNHRQCRPQRGRRLVRRAPDHPHAAGGRLEAVGIGGRAVKQFDLYEPTSLNEATGLLNQFGAGAKVVAGGSDLLGGVMKDWVQGKGMPLPSQIIDLTTIPNMSGITSSSDGMHIGATTTLTDVINSQDVQNSIPLLS